VERIDHYRDGLAEHPVELSLLCHIVHHHKVESLRRIIGIAELSRLGKITRMIHSDLVDFDPGPAGMVVTEEAQPSADQITRLEALLRKRRARDQTCQEREDNSARQINLPR
jgi:hypothetical protein